MLNNQCKLFNSAVKKAELSIDVPLNYYSVFYHVQDIIPTDAIIVCEGWNTMKIGATMLQNILPRHRLDAGTFGAMGVSMINI